jgi:hypothetical protein
LITALSYCELSLFVTSLNLTTHFDVSGSCHNTLIAKFDNIFAISILFNDVFIFAVSIESVVVILFDLANEYASLNSFV